MTLPNWFKVSWWILLIALFGAILVSRYGALLAGGNLTLNAVLVVWLALLLLPLIQEFSFFGFTLKKEIEHLKTSVKDDVASIKSEIRNSIDVRSHFSPSIVFPQPPPDSQLPQIQKSLDDLLAQQQLSHNRLSVDDLTVPADVETLFSARFNVERELRRISEQLGNEVHNVTNITQVIRDLVVAGLIDQGIERAIRELWRVTSPAIHGEPTSAAKVDFARNVALSILPSLRAI